MLNARHQALLEARKLDVELLETLGVTTCEGAASWIEIPYTQNGRVVNHKRRTLEPSNKRFYQDKDAVKCFYNFDVLLDRTLADRPLVITEGEVDCWTALQCGFPRVVSVPDGAPAKPMGVDGRESAKYEFLKSAEALLRDVREIIIAADGDDAGANLLADLSHLLGRQRCKFLRYPTKGPLKRSERCKDLNEVLCHWGAAGVVAVINSAEWVRVDGIYRMSELPPLPNVAAFDVKIPCLAKHWKIRLGDLTIVTGIPGHGKSTFIGHVAGNMANAYGWTTALASFEQKAQTDLKRNLRTFFARRRAATLSDAERRDADQWIDEHFALMSPSEDEDCTLAWILERMAAAAVQWSARLHVIDPWNELDHDRPPDMSLTEYTGYAIKQFRRLASKYQIHVIVAAHPTKLKPDRDGKLPMPTLYDISDSAHWANKADAGIVLWRGQKGEGSYIHVQKTRYDEIGEPGKLECTVLKDQARFEIIDPAAESYDPQERML